MANGKFINKLTIYGLVSEKDSNNIRYVGITRRKPEYRLSSHIYDAKNFPNKNHRTKWISDENLKIKQIILDVIIEEDSDFWEKYWISLVKSWGFTLVNSNKGGGGLDKRSEEFSKWLSERSKGNKYNLGKSHSDETKIKMSKIKLGKESPRKGCVVSDKTKLKQSIAKLGKVGNAKGFKHTEETKNKKRKEVIQLDLNGNFIRDYSSVSEVAEYFKVSIPTISKVLNKTNKKYKNFVFKVKNENYG